MLIDTHAHIYLEDFKNDISEVISRAVDQGIENIYLPNIDHTTIEDMLELELKFPYICKPMIGLHPCSVKKDFEKELYLVEDWILKHKFFAVGEMGTDLYWDKSHWGEQQEAFRIQAALARDHNLPLVIHCRETLGETIEMVEDIGDAKGVFHCFTGSVDQAKKIEKLGFFMGIGGIATFKNGGLDKVLPEMSKDHIVLETDSPYLAPVPFRGKRNEPSYIRNISERVAEILETGTDEIIEATTRNANKLFNQK